MILQVKYNFHFTDKEIETQKTWEVCSNSHVDKEWSCEWKPSSGNLRIQDTV